MSERRKELITEGNTIKQAISIILIAILLFGLYLGSIALFGLIFGIRTTPSDELANAPEEEAELFDIAFDMFNLTDLLDYDDLLEHAGEAVFYIEDYDPFDESWLWKFSVADEYNNDGSWSQSVSGVSPTEFTYWHDYNNDYSDRDIIRIKYPIDATAGENSLVIPALFPTPYIMDHPWEHSWVDPWSPEFDESSLLLYKDIFNVASMSFSFDEAYSCNLTYDLFSESVMSPTELNTSAVMETYTPNAIKDQYYQLPDPGGIPGYILNNPNFKSHYDALDAIINSTDNAYVKANKIRNYLQENFDVDVLPPYNRPAHGQDVVEWFCGEQSGIFSDFAATFTAFARAFGIASRYVDGFNSRKFPIYPSEHYNAQEDKNYSIIRRLNLYSWSEIYVPLIVDGSGVWTEMDVLFESFGGGNPLTFEEMELNVYTNTTTPVIRGDSVEIIAELFSDGTPQEGINIIFEDSTENNPNLGEGITNNDGKCSIIVDINDQTVAGPHLIQASTGFTINYTIYFLNAPIEVNLTDVDPTIIDKTVSSNTRIMGVLFDPLNGKGVSNGEVGFILLDSSNNKISLAFTPDSELTDNDGDYNTIVYVNDHVVSGTYDVRVDFNGSFQIGFLSGVFSQFYSYPLLCDSSSEISVDIINPDATFLDLFINGYPSDDFSNPRVKRNTSVELRVALYSLSGPLQGRTINFYDITEDPSGPPIHTNDTNFNGEIFFSYNLNFDKIAGPHLICVEWGNLRNYSYFVLDDNVRIDLNPPSPVPNIINRTDEGDYTFNIKGSILDDTNNNPIKYAQVSVRLFKDSVDYSGYLQPPYPTLFDCGEDGSFDLTFNVNDAIVLGNYSIRVDFNGTFNYMNHAYPYFFTLDYINTLTSADMDLKIESPDVFIFNFWINGTPSSAYEEPVVKRDQDLNLTVYLQSGATPVAGKSVTFYDLTNDDSFIGEGNTNANGSTSIIYDLDSISLAAGPHLIYAKYGDEYNYSYFILNESIYVELVSGPTPPTINNIGTVGRVFNLLGYIKDKSNDMHIKNCWVNFRTNSSYNYLTVQDCNCGTSGIFDLNSEVENGTPVANYTLQIEFIGLFDYWTSPYPYIFSLSSFNNFVNSTQPSLELKVLDPNMILIEFWINETETSLNYNGGNLPVTFKRSDYVNFTVRVYQSGDTVDNGFVYFYDVLENNKLLGTAPIMDDPYKGFANITLPLDNSWVAGPHKIRVKWESYDTYNYTYIVLNETVTVEISSNTNSVIRDVDWITVSGCVNDTISQIKVKQVEVNIRLFNKITMADNTNYLIIDWDQSYMLTRNGNSWNYKFTFRLNISTPPGEYYLRVDFNGSIRDYTSPVFIDLNNYMINSSSIPKVLNVSAGTNIIDGYYDSYFEDYFGEGEIIIIHGNLTWDNGIAMVGYDVNMTLEDSQGYVYAEISNTTLVGGEFWGYITIQSGWDLADRVFATYYGDNFILEFRIRLPWV